MPTGKCEHGEFELEKGCELCMAEYASVNSEANIAERIKAVQPKKESPLHIVKVKYFSETTGSLSEREYTYYSEAQLNVEDVVVVPVRDTKGKATVSAVDVPEVEIANFKDKVKTIPANSIVKPETLAEVLCMSEEDCHNRDGAYCDGGSPDCAFAEREGNMNRDRHYGLAPEPLSEEARKILTGGRDKMIDAATTALTLRPGEDIEVHNYYEQALGLKAYAEKRVIATVEDIKPATDDLSAIAKLRKAMEAKKREYLDPLKLQAEAIRETYSSLMDPVLSADKITRDKILAFNREQDRKRLEQEEINRLRMKAAQKEMELKGELTEDVNLVEVAPEAPKRVSTAMGTSGLRDNWKYEVTDFSLLPDRFKMENATLIGKVVRAGEREIPGVRIYNEPSITVRAK